jgi:hypothetical protein
VYSNNPHILDEFKKCIQEAITAITSVEVSELEVVSNNLLKRSEVCLKAEGRR